MDAKQKIILVLTILFFALVAFKIFYLNYTLAMVVPVVGLKVNIAMSVDGHGSEVKVTTTLPGSNERQTIFDETVAATKFNFNIYNQDGNRFGLWQATSLSGQHDFAYTFYFKGRKIRYTLPDSLPRSLSYPEALGKHLSDTDLVQTGAPIIAEALAD
ncbi:UUP1 family membrane protein, partial [candidate division KSB1 bacterium]|nr:UUP1 family membrane protein [candidate division KSB1 bacterium]